MIWQTPHILWILLVIPILLAGQWWIKKNRTKKREQFFDGSLFEKLYKGFWQTGSNIKSICFYIGLALFIVAAAGPKIGTKVKEVKREGIELLIALDLSASMNAEDVEPSRLDKAKYEISRLLDQLKGDRVGLIIFTGSAFLQVPMTLDYSAMNMFLDITETDQMPSTTTNIGSAMKMAAKIFSEEKKDDAKNKASEVLLIISDGENQGDGYDQALEELEKLGVTVFTLGIGTIEGGTIPLYNDNGTLVGYKRNNEGKIVTTALMPKVLKNIAGDGGGKYYQIGGAGAGISDFIADTKSLEQGKFASKVFADYENQYWWLTAIGLGFLLVSLVFPDYKKR